ncbi:hypothetical protein [Actinomadura viridis]|uniref:Uncharacterized protein n=1 Tax=Actinomadura viridis TaxID=58110 RepID=A0A931DNK2_9ACTN|nr:hypothetical protein [Actinomadura viridis]MBG6091843.1 hypothetical protein [Actinomadura viridis]
MTLLVGLTGVALTAAAPASASAEPDGGVVLIGVPGLRWGDVEPASTPVLWHAADRGGIANIAVRGVEPRSCAAGGWLTISAGARAEPPHGGCGRPPRPRRDGAGAVVPGHPDLRAHNAATTYAAQVGLLGDAVHRAGGCTTAVGRGGALAVADSSGRVDHYRDDVGDMRAHDWKRCALTAVDIDDLTHGTGGRAAEPAGAAGAAASRTAALSRADRRVGEVLARVQENATVLIVGVADVGRPGLRVTMHLGPSTAPGYLSVPSTRRTGLLTLTDVTPTVLRLAGAPVPARLTGASWTHRAPRPEERAAAIERLRERDLAARVARSMVAPFNIVLVGGQLLAYGLAALAWRRCRAERRGLVLTATRYVALAAAAAPAATYLANLVPWWRAGHPAAGLAAAVAVADVAVVAVALAGPWRRRPFGPVTGVAAVTALTLAADVIAGSPLQADSLNGNFSLVAGRFYGFGNLTFALFATASLVCAAGLAGPVAAAGHRHRAAALALLIGGAAVVVDGWPGWGSDFGGVLALTPGVVLLALWAAGRRVSARPVLLAGGAGALLVGGLAYLDSLRPADSRSHLGDFWKRMLDGGAGPILERKVDSMLNSLGNVWLTLPATLALVLLMAFLLRRDGVLGPVFRRTPALRVALLAVLVTTAVGFAVNDSGIAIPALAALFAAPLTVTTALAVRSADGIGAPGVPEP